MAERLAYTDVLVRPAFDWHVALNSDIGVFCSHLPIAPTCDNQFCSKRSTSDYVDDEVAGIQRRADVFDHESLRSERLFRHEVGQEKQHRHGNRDKDEIDGDGQQHDVGCWVRRRLLKLSLTSEIYGRLRQVM